jgi:hypothetical protein
MSESATEARKATWSVWQIVEDMESRLEETGGEVTPDIDALECLSADEARFAVAQWIAAFKEFRGRRDGANAMKQHYAKRMESDSRQMDACKAKIEELLGFLEERKVASPYGTAFKSKGKPHVEVDEDALPRLVELMLADPQPPKVDKAEIAKMLRNGHAIPGCRMVDGEEGIVVK